MARETLLTTAALEKFWRTALIDLPNGKTIALFKKLMSFSLEQLFIKAVKQTEIDLKREKLKT